MGKTQSKIQINTNRGVETFSGISKEYKEIYDTEKIVDNSDTLFNLIEFDTESIVENKLRGAKSVFLKNTGEGGVEIQLTIDSWTNATPDANSGYRYINFLLGKGEYMHLPITRLVDFDTSVTSAANAYSRTSEALSGVGWQTFAASGTAEAMNETETEWTVDSNVGYYFRVGDYLIIDENDPDTANSAEIVKVTSITSDTVINVERAQLGTTAVAHADNIDLYSLHVNLAAKNPYVWYQGTGLATTDGNPDTITDTANGLSSAGFLPGMHLRLIMQGGSSKYGIINTVAAGTIVLTLPADLGADSAGTETILTGIYTTTTETGRYSHNNVQGGYGRLNTTGARGIVPGSFACQFSTGGHQSFGINNCSASKSSGLAASTAYRFGLNIDGVTQVISFTTDSSNLRFGGSNGIVNKIQKAINDLVDDGSYLYGATVGIIDGDLMIKTKNNAHGMETSGSWTIIDVMSRPYSGVASIDIADAGSGSGTQLLGQGNFPKSPRPRVASKWEDITKLNDNGEYVPDSSVFMYDDGNGNLYVPSGSQITGHGTIDYDTGALEIYNAPPLAEIRYSFNYTSALSGKLDTTATRGNTITKIAARGVNQHVDGKVKLVVLS